MFSPRARSPRSSIAAEKEKQNWKCSPLFLKNGEEKWDTLHLKRGADRSSASRKSQKKICESSDVERKRKQQINIRCASREMLER